MIVAAVGIALAFSEGSYASSCKRTPRPTEQLDASKLLPGTYEIRLIAARGSKSGNAVVGTLWLERTSRDDVSPITNQSPAKTEDLTKIPLFGSLDADFRAIGAPVWSGDADAPDSTSRDPIRPGVLVELISWDPKYPSRTPVLTVGALSNLRAETGWLDGPGIGLWVHDLDDQGFTGRWSEWGILKDGSGYFCARRLSP